MAITDSLWLTSAVDAWERTSQRALQLPHEPLPLIILFNRRCAFRVIWRDSLRMSGAPHGNAIRLPNNRTIQPVGIGVTSPTLKDTALFLALALPDVWAADPRYRAINDTRVSWERYLTRAFIHEMTHARMLPSILPQLRALEAFVYPDTIEDNAVQNRFGKDRAFAAAIVRESDLLYRAASATNRKMRMELASSAIALMRARRARYYTDDLASWAELEQTFLDMEGVAEWAALMHTRSTVRRDETFEHTLARFRASREFWSEDQGLSLILALDALVPGWQARMFARQPASSLELLAQAVGATPPA